MHFSDPKRADNNIDNAHGWILASNRCFERDTRLGDVVENRKDREYETTMMVYESKQLNGIPAFVYLPQITSERDCLKGMNRAVLVAEDARNRICLL